MSSNYVLATVIEMVLVVLVLLGVVFNKRLVAWEDKHVPEVRGFFAGLGYAFLIWLDKLFDLAALCVAKIIVKLRGIYDKRLDRQHKIGLQRYRSIKPRC